MKILHFGTLDVNAGGPAMSTYYTLLGLNQLGAQAELMMYPLTVGGRLRGENVQVHFAKAPLEQKMGYTPVLKKEIQQLGTYDIYHAQGLWQYPTYALADIARKQNKPYLITPRGMLYPQDIAKSNKGFKELSLKLRLLKDLNEAACVQVTCEEEMLHCRRLGVTSAIAVIPNPIEIKDYTAKKKDSVFRLGYLGRISPRKNIEGLIYAWVDLKEKVGDAELLIIGGGDAAYENFLRSEAKRLKLKNVRFTGFLSGQEKDDAIASLSVLAMPSEFENFGNVILEGLIRGIPCIATKGAPWQELETEHCGWWAEYRPEAIKKAIESALIIPADELKGMGKNGRALVEEKYSIEAVASKMKQMYEWVLNEKPKPEFIFL